MNEPDTSWGCDVPISMPEPVEIDPNFSADMGSHVFTEDGLRIALNRSTLQESFAPTYAPPPPGTVS
jgi:hypothetical protein